MRVLVWDESFRRAFKKLIRRQPQLQEKIFEVLAFLETDPFTPALKTHKLQGQLKGLWACWVEYVPSFVTLMREK
jgi:mRNA interferase YafQ